MDFSGQRLTAETKMALVIDWATGAPDPTPPVTPDDDIDAARLPLRNGVDVRRELAKVYREARSGKLDKAEAAKLTYILGELRKAIELEEIERRLDALESAKALPAPR